MTILKSLPTILKKAYHLLQDNDPLILASATAFFATFSISPIIIILVNILSLCFKSDTIRTQLFNSLEKTFGNKTVAVVESMVNNFISLESSLWITIGVSVFLLFVATTLLRIVRKAIYQVWNMRQTTSLKFVYDLKERLVGLGMLLFMGILFLFSLLLDASVVAFHNYTQETIPILDSLFVRSLNLAFSILIVTTWFTIVFKVLPEAHVHWKVAFAGGFITGILFTIGKYILGLILIESKLETIFDASASITLLLLFIFYSSIIMYYGAAFTRVYATYIGKSIRPGKYAYEYEERAIPSVSPTISQGK